MTRKAAETPDQKQSEAAPAAPPPETAPIPKPKRTHGLAYRMAEALDHWVKTNPFSRLTGLLFAVVGGIVLIGTGMQIILDYQDRAEDRLARAWETAMRPVAGNTGKGAAISFLLLQGQNLTGLDVSCQRMQGGWDAAERKCRARPVLSDLSVPEGMEDLTKRWDLSGTEVSRADMKGVSLTAFSGRDTNFIGGDLREARLEGDLENAAFYGVLLADAVLKYRPSTADAPALDPTFSIIRSEISDLIIWTTIEEGVLLSENFAWADQPPWRANSEFDETQLALAEVKYCDPTGKRKMLREPIGVAAGDPSKPPNLREPALLVEADRCREMTEAEARLAFPEAWKEIERPD
ncbi:pentapeptide repeat-containing protein [Nitratireductor pacificus]|uniref:Pentapeptide repeat-containing protein n=1 Tax=Nitratireductor pacificus pht-3B TaxID=391937 RepID=K2M809_9HYPH|nr:pentapeptide repeat-containing protein [Nitratireductor pacificus]EKF17090.1 pentapeptide repeat-containing protein [Nitratireductor pacificus pht-3B]